MKPLKLVINNIVKIVNKYNLIGGRLNANIINRNIKDFKPYLEKVTNTLNIKNKQQRDNKIKNLLGGDKSMKKKDIDLIIQKFGELEVLKKGLNEISEKGVEKTQNYLFIAHLLENTEMGDIITIGFDSFETYLRTLETSLVLMDPILELGGDTATTIINSSLSSISPGTGTLISIIGRPMQKIIINVIKHNIKTFPIFFIILLNISRRRFSEAIGDFYTLIPYVDDLIIYTLNLVKALNTGLKMGNNYVKLINLIGEKSLAGLDDYNKIIN